MLEFLVGSSLAAAAGLNAWMPLFALGLLDRLLPGFALPNAWSWLSGDVALWIIGTLLVVEIVADKIPAVDSVNDAIQTFIRPASGALLAAAAASDVGEQWASALALVLGLVTAAGVHATKATVRPVVNVSTAGVGAPVVSTVEDGVSVGLSLAALLAPLLALIALIAMAIGAALALRRVFSRRRTGSA